MIYKNQTILGSYLAGLWEGDGHITIKKKIKPSFHINFNIKDAAVAKKLLNYITHKCTAMAGSIRYQTEKNICVLNIWSVEGLKFIVSLINGKLRTPKVYQINIIIDWLNNNHNAGIVKTMRNWENITKDAWLAGFIDLCPDFAGQRQGCGR